MNAPLKSLIEEEFDNWCDRNHQRIATGSITTSEKRVELTRWVGAAWERFHEKYKTTIKTTFRRLGISLNPDGTEDHEISIKKQDDLQVGDYMIGAPAEWQDIPIDAQLELVEALSEEEDELASGMEVTLAEEDDRVEEEQEEQDNDGPGDDREYIDVAQEEALATTATQQLQLFTLKDDGSEDELAI